MSIQMTSVPLGPELTYPSKQAQEWLPGLLTHIWEQSPLFTWHSLMSWQVRPSSFKENPSGHEQWNDPSVFAQEYSQSPFPLFLAHSFMSTQLRDLVKIKLRYCSISYFDPLINGYLKKYTVHACINPRRFFSTKVRFCACGAWRNVPNLDLRVPCNAEIKDDEHLLIEPETENLNEIICNASNSEVCANMF